jgi:hypothetical protein
VLVAAPTSRNTKIPLNDQEIRSCMYQHQCYAKVPFTFTLASHFGLPEP